MTNNLSSALQENILILLCFDDKTAPLIIDNIEYTMFENEYYRRIAQVAIAFFEKFKTVIGEVHLPDELESELLDDKTRDIYSKIIGDLYEAKDGVSKDYVLSNLNKFVRLQNAKILLKKGAEYLKGGKIDEWEAEINRTRSKRVELFDAGTRFGIDLARTLDIASFDDDMIMTGIKALDRLGHTPTKKEMWTLMGRAGGKKSWACVHLGKMGLLQRKRVLHVTLELSEDRLKQRYFQALFGIGSKVEDMQYMTAFFDNESNGRISSVDFRNLPYVPLMTDPRIMEDIARKVQRLRYPQLVIKEFPTGALSVDMLYAYLDNLEHYYNFIPDLLILDYLDLMDIDVNKMRLDLGRVGVELRGLAVDRKLALMTVAQSNRAGDDVVLLTRKHLGEDYSKVRTTDVLVTTNSTKMEREHGLMRLYVDKGRNGRDGDVIVLAQNISIGQYCLNSGLISKTYFDTMMKENNAA